MNIKKIMSVVLAGAMALSIAGCNIVERTPESIGKTVLAKVDGDKITKADLDEEMKPKIEQYKAYYGDDYESNEAIKDTLKEEKQNYLESLVQKKVLLKAAVDLDVMPSDDEINEYIDSQVSRLKQYYNNDEDQYQQYIESIGFTDESLEKYFKEDLIASNAAEKLVEDVDVSDDEIQSFYDSNKEQYKVAAGADVTHVLFTGDNAEENAKKAKKYAEDGKSLEDISKMDEFKDVCSYENLGHKNFENSGLVTEFENAFKALPANKVSDPVKTSYGWHIIYNTKVNAEEYTQTFDEVKDTVKETVLNNKKQEAYKDKIEEYKEKYDTKIYDDKL